MDKGRGPHLLSTNLLPLAFKDFSVIKKKEITKKENLRIDKQGKFSVGSAYRNSQRTHTQPSYWPRKMICKVKVRLKVASFTWHLAKHAVLT